MDDLNEVESVKEDVQASKRKKGHQPRFTREQLLKSSAFSLRPDLVRAVLKKDHEYTIEEVELRIAKFYGKDKF